jgi:hypothetical protein
MSKIPQEPVSVGNFSNRSPSHHRHVGQPPPRPRVAHLALMDTQMATLGLLFFSTRALVFSTHKAGDGGSCLGASF